MTEIKYVELKDLQGIIPEILFKKFIKFELVKVENILELTTEDFRGFPYVGEKVAKLYDDFRHVILNEPDKIIRYYKENLPKSLPFSFFEEINLIELFQLIIEDYFSIKETYNYKTEKDKQRHTRDIDVIRKFYGLKSQQYDREKIARRHRLNRERIRQIVNIEFIQEVKEIINGDYIEKWNCKCRSEAIELIQSFKKDLAGSPILSEYKLFLWLKDYGIEKEYIQRKNYFLLLLKTWGYEQLALSRHYQLRNNILFADESVDKELFLNIGTKIINFLENKVIPVSFDDIVIEVLDVYDVEDDFIQLTCDVIYDIEKTDTGYYQIRFENLSSINDYVYRLLYEKQKRLIYNELLHLINKRLVHVNMEITMESLKQTLKKDDFIVPIGRTGAWTLTDLNTNIESQVNLILKTFRTLDKPLTVSEITRHINESYSRRDVTARSVSSNLRNYKKYFIKIKGNRFVLAETIDLYKNEIVKTKSPVKKKGLLKKDEIANKAIKILENAGNNRMLLKELIGILTQTNSNYSRMDIYKAIRENPLIFKKEKVSLTEKAVTLITKPKNLQNELTDKYKWIELKKILERELKPIFHSNIQPSYPITLENALDAFFKIITVDISANCLELVDLADRILPTLYKFYVGASDRNDKLNYLKQIVTSQESYFKKLLYFISNSDYNFIKTNNKGFGAVLDKLTKVDSRKNRYQDYRAASNYEFGKHCSRAYNNRNIDTHNANSWTEAEIIDTKTSCLVFMVYSAFEYYNEIKRI